MLVTARQFPGIDETKLAATPEPRPLRASTRRMAAPELIGALEDAPVTESEDGSNVVSVDFTRKK